MTDLTHWKGQVNPDYLGAYAVPPNGSLILTIKDVHKDLVASPSGEKKECLVVYWKEDYKPMVCNRTNGKAIEKALKSPYIETWKGKQVELYSSRVKAFGEEIDALRVRNIAPVAKVIDPKKAIESVNKAKTVDELRKFYMALTPEEQAHKDVIKAKDDMKAKLS